jgi:hypothetical protein
MEKAVQKGNLDAAANLGRIFAIGMHDNKGGQLVKVNATKCMYNLNLAISGDLPSGMHTFAEILHLNLIDVPKTYVEKYNITTDERKCTVSVQFYAKSILRGFLKTWLKLAEKRYVL